MVGESHDQGGGILSDPDFQLSIDQADDAVGYVESSPTTFPLQEPKAFFFGDNARIADLRTCPVI